MCNLAWVRGQTDTGLKPPFSYLVLIKKCFVFSCRKYNSLIQAQARELSHLRQRIREGQGVCHILTQHLGDTTKVLEA